MPNAESGLGALSVLEVALVLTDHQPQVNETGVPVARCMCGWRSEPYDFIETSARKLHIAHVSEQIVASVTSPGEVTE